MLLCEAHWIEQFRQWGFSLLNKSWNLSPTITNGEDAELKTNAVRINKEMLSKIKKIASSKKMKVPGYIETLLEKKVLNDYNKLVNKK